MFRISTTLDNLLWFPYLIRYTLNKSASKILHKTGANKMQDEVAISLITKIRPGVHGEDLHIA